MGKIADNLMMREISGSTRSLLETSFTIDFDVNWARRITALGSDVEAFLLKPGKAIIERFGFEKEIIALFLPYSTVEPRVFGIVEQVRELLDPPGRTESLCFFLVCNSPGSVEQVRRFRLEQTSHRIAIPLCVTELSSGNPHLIRNRMEEFLYSKNLFDVTKPLTDDHYFFGRESLVLEIADSIRAGEGIGLFGLRKSGKTSLLFKVRRLFERDLVGKMVYIDAQDTAIYNLRWNELIELIRSQLPKAGGEGKVELVNVGRAFRDTLAKLNKRNPECRYCLAIDEVEHILPKTRMAEHWDEDFHHFWKTIRSIRDQSPNFSIIVAGVNAVPIEKPSYGGHDNPLFSMVKVRYMPFMDRKEVSAMCTTLGKWMGVRPEPEYIDDLMAEYGGHPLLTRMAISFDATAVSGLRGKPIRLSRQDFVDNKAARNRDLHQWGLHVTEVLRLWYPEEYEMLQLLAGGKVDEFKFLSSSDPLLTKHLISYSLLDRSGTSFVTGYMQTFIRDQGSAVIEDGDNIELLVEIGRLRNALEPKLRKLIKRVLRQCLGPERWIDPVIKMLPEQERQKCQGLSSDDIIAKKTFLIQLLSVIIDNWASFCFFEKANQKDKVTKEQFKVILEYINAHREDAHAGEISGPQMATLRIAVAAINKSVSAFLAD